MQRRRSNTQPRPPCRRRRVEGWLTAPARKRRPSIVPQGAGATPAATCALQDAWTARETAQFAVRPGQLAIEIGDAVTHDRLIPERRDRIGSREITDGAQS